MVMDFSLSPPWNTYYSEVEELFKHDPKVNVVFDSDNYEIKFYVDDAAKADAMTMLLPTEKVFGNIKVKITVIPANDVVADHVEFDGIADMYATMFDGNEAVEQVHTATLPGSVYTFNYVIFKNKVVQYFNDDLSDAHGLCSTLYQDIAKRIFGEDAKVFFCTAPSGNNLGKPLGEWP